MDFIRKQYNSLRSTNNLAKMRVNTSHFGKKALQLNAMYSNWKIIQKRKEQQGTVFFV